MAERTPFTAELFEDARAHQRLKRPGRPASPWSTAKLAVASRGLLLLEGHRVHQRLTAWAEAHPSALLRGAARIAGLGLTWWVQVLTRSDIRPDSRIAPGVYLSDRGHILLGASFVGAGTVVHERVTVGTGVKSEGTPRIGERVWIGPDCIVAGAIQVGDGCTVLPGTVLTRSLPPGTVVKGNPAVLVRRGFDNSALRASLATDVEVAPAPQEPRP